MTPGYEHMHMSWFEGKHGKQRCMWEGKMGLSSICDMLTNFQVGVMISTNCLYMLSPICSFFYFSFCLLTLFSYLICISYRTSLQQKEMNLKITS